LKEVPGGHCCVGPDELEAFLGQCDILVNMLPLTPEKDGLLNATRLECLPHGWTDKRRTRRSRYRSGSAFNTWLELLMLVIAPTWMEEEGLQVIQSNQPLDIVLQIPLALLFADLSRHPCVKGSSTVKPEYTRIPLWVGQRTW
jgi:hypothetical protein